MYCGLGEGIFSLGGAPGVPGPGSISMFHSVPLQMVREFGPYVTSSKLGLFQVGAGLDQSRFLSPILLISVIERIYMCSEGAE